MEKTDWEMWVVFAGGENFGENEFEGGGFEFLQTRARDHSAALPCGILENSIGLQGNW